MHLHTHHWSKLALENTTVKSDLEQFLAAEKLVELEAAFGELKSIIFRSSDQLDSSLPSPILPHFSHDPSPLEQTKAEKLCRKLAHSMFAGTGGDASVLYVTLEKIKTVSLCVLVFRLFG